MLYTNIELAKAYGLELAIFAQQIYDCSVYLGIENQDGRWIFTTITDMHKALFPFWTEKHLRRMSKNAEDMKLIKLTKELDGVERKGHGMWLSIDYDRSPFTPWNVELFTGGEGGFAKTKEPAMPVETIVAWWNKELVNLSPVSKITPSRVKKIKNRVKEGLLDSLDTIAENIKDSDFLSGKETHWSISFDWLVENDTNWCKVAEGKYNDRKAKIKPAEFDSDSIKAMKKKMGGKK